MTRTPRTASTGPDVAVIGAGVLGLAVAMELTARGRRVQVVDPGGPNASSIAAGMIAPAMESALDGANPDRAALLRAAAGLWPAFAARAGVLLTEADAEWRGPGAEAVAASLVALGFSAVRDGDQVRIDGDLRIDPETALAAWRTGLPTPPMTARIERVERETGGWAVHGDGRHVLTAPALVLATGAAPAIPGSPLIAARLIGAIQPIRGQIGRVAAPLTRGTLRGPDVYVTPLEDGAVIGATMEAGRRDLTPDAEASARLSRAAEVLLGHPLDQGVEWRVGVRGATTDGLPMAGPIGDGLHLAMAPRRNGWLMAPLVAAVAADGIEGRPAGPFAPALDPLRFI